MKLVAYLEIAQIIVCLRKNVLTGNSTRISIIFILESMKNMKFDKFHKSIQICN